MRSKTALAGNRKRFYGARGSRGQRERGTEPVKPGSAWANEIEYPPLHSQGAGQGIPPGTELRAAKQTCGVMGNYLPRTYRAAWDNRDHTARALPGYGGTVLPHNAATKGSVSKHNHPVHNQLPGTIKFQSGPTIVAKYNEYMRGISSDQDIRRIEDIRLPIPKGILESRIIGECGTEYLFETTVYFKVPNYRPLRFAGAYTLL